MIVCVCANVTDRELRAVIADGATTAKEIGRRCGAGAGCGACKPLLRECLRVCRDAAACATPPLAAAELPTIDTAAA